MAEEINDLNESIRQLTAAISEMAGTFDSVAGQSKTASDNLNKMSAGAKNADANVNNMARATISSKGALNQFNTSTQEATEKQYAFKAAMASGIAATLGFVDALISTEPGFTKFSGALSAAGDAALSLGKSQGPVGEVLGRIVKAGTMVAEQYLDQGDSVFKARNELFKFAGASSMGSNELLDLGQNLGFTSKQLDSIIKPLRSMGPSLLSLGDSAGEGAKRFLNLSVVSEETRERFIRMGVMPEELLQSQADYINLTRLSGNQASMRLKTDKQIQEESLRYAESLKVLSELTGEDAETVKKRQEAALNDFRFQAKITSMRAEAAAIAESDPEGAKKLLDNAKNMQDSVAIAAALSPELAEQAKSLILTGGNITEFTSNLAVAGVDTQKFAEAMESGDPAAMLHFLQDVMDSTAGQAERFGDMVGYMSDEQLNSLGINRGSMDLLTKYQQEGMNLVDAVAKIKEGLATTGQAGTDPLADAQANLTTTQMDLAVGFDNLLQNTSPLMQGFTDVTIASTALAAAAAAAAAALGAIALTRGVGSIFGGGGGRDGGRDDGRDDRRDGGGGGSRLGKVFGGATRLLGKAAVPLAVGMAGYDAYKGFTADSDADMGERFRNAGSSALSGLTFGMLGSDSDEIAARRQDNISDATPTATPAATPTATPAATPTATPTAEIPWDAMRELASQKFDQTESDNITTNIALLKTFGEAMSSIPEIKGNRQGGITEALLGAEKMPWELIKDFGNAELPPVEQIQKNAAVVGEFSKSIEAISAVSDIKMVKTGIFGGMFSSFDMPWEVINDFGNTELPPVEQIQTNQKIINAFANAVIDMSNIPDIKRIETGIFGGMFSSFDMPWDVINDFGNTELPPVEQIQKNAAVVVEFSKSIEAISAVSDIKMVETGLFGGLFSSFDMPWDVINDFGNTELPPVEQIQKNAAVVVEFSKSIEAISAVSDIKMVETGLFGGLFSSFDMPWDVINDFGNTELPSVEQIQTNQKIINAFANAVIDMSNIPDIKRIETGIFGGLFSSFDMPWDVINDFGNTELPPVEQIQTNQKIINAFANAVIDMSNIPDIKMIETGIFGGLFSSFDMPWDVINDFGNTELPPVEQIQKNQEIINAFINAVIDMSNIPDIKMIETGIFGGLFSSVDMPWNIINDFGNAELPSVEQIQKNQEVINAFASAATVMTSIPEIKFSEESEDSLDRLTDKLKDFSKLNTGDILDNISALGELSKLTNENQRIEQLQTPTAPTLPSTPDQTVSRITPAPAVLNTTSGSTAPAVTTQTTAASTNTEINDIMSLLSYKLDNVISLLETGVTIQDRILLESRS